MGKDVQIEEKRAFVINPFLVDEHHVHVEKTLKYGQLTARISSIHSDPVLRSIGGMRAALAATGLVRQARFGAVVDTIDLFDGHKLARDPIRQFLFQAYQVGNPGQVRKAQIESLHIVRQLKKLGHPVFISDFGDPRHSIFIRAAIRGGANRLPTDTTESREHRELHEIMQGTYGGMGWARDGHVYIGGKLEKPEKSVRALASGKMHFFGEGGGMIQVGPKEWLITKYIARDPRVKKYESKGFKFIEVPDGLHYDPTLSELMQTPIFNSAPHIDFNFGAIPEKKVVAVCPNYSSEHKLTVQLLERNLGVTIVEVPEEEAKRHPANFLPLGEGKVLVDSGAPKFIERLRQAGVEVNPTAVPLDYILANKDGLHCLFNEIQNNHISK